MASTYAFWPSVLGRMLLPRVVRIAWLSTSAGLPSPRSRIRADEVTSTGPRSAPLRTSWMSSCTRRSAAATCSGGPSRVTRLPRTSTVTSGYWCSIVVSRRSWGPSSRTMATPSTWNSACPLDERGGVSLEAKGAFRHFRVFGVQPQDVGVHMEHGLACTLAGVEHQPVVAARSLVGETLRDRDQVG